MRLLVIASFAHLIAGSLAVNIANATTIVFDDFSDMNLRDGSPTTWQFGSSLSFGADIDASTGDAVFTVGENFRGLVTSFDIAGDVSVRTQIRVTAGAQFGITTNWGEGPAGNTNDGYFLQTAVDSTNSLFAVARVNNMLSEVADVSIPTSIGVDRDVLLQMDVVGNQIEGWLWEVGSSPPSSPQVTLTLDETIAAGEAGVYINRGTAMVRYIQIADSPIPVPEPANLGLSLAAIIFAVSGRSVAQRP